MDKKVAFLDLRILDTKERGEILSAINRVFDHGVMVLGAECTDLEEKFASLCRRRYGIGVCSGTTALYLGLRALGIGPGDEVITTALSWVATANAIAMTGASPVFADIRSDLNIDPESVAKLVTKKTKAILPVHYTGKICAIEKLQAIAQAHNIDIVEDAAQAFGATRVGNPSGSFGKIAAFSMNPMKVFAACGEAGMLVTDDQTLSERLISLRYNGTINREVCVESSINARLDALQAAILTARLPKVPSVIARRRELGGLYARRLQGIVEIPLEEPNCTDSYYTYTIKCDKRDELKTFLESRGVETKIQHPALMPEQPVYQGKTKGDYPHAQKIVKQILSIPCNEKITNNQVDYVCDQIIEFFKGSR